MSSTKIVNKNILHLFVGFCCAVLLLPIFVHAEGLINTGGCSGVPGADGGDCRNVEILLIQAISLIEYLFGIIGTLAFIMFIYGGLKMIMSFGSEDKFKEGREAMVNAVIGMVIAFSAYILVNFTLDVLGVNKDYRAVGQESSQESSNDGSGAVSGGTCTTNSDCDNQFVCREGACTSLCAAVGGRCGEWTAESCASPNTIQSNLCPSPNGNDNWKCCAPAPSPTPTP